jgi:hypothetical protein
MEAEDFAVYEPEWWHYDYKDWKEYPILNISFSDIGRLHTKTPSHQQHQRITALRVLVPSL